MKGGRLVVIARPGLSLGFVLAGVPVLEESHGRDAAARIRGLISSSRHDTAVVLIDEALYAELPEEFRRESGQHALPVIIPVPGPQWTEESKAQEYIVEILRRAIGYRVRLQ